MDDPQTMSVLDGAGQNRDHLRRRSGWPGGVVEPVGEVASLGILHLEVRPAVVVAKSVDLNDIGVPNPGDGLGLGQEADEVLGAGMFALQDHFQSAKAVEPELARLVNDGHAAAAQLGKGLIARDLRRWVRGDLRALARSPGGPETVAHLILGGTERIRDPEEAILVRPRIAGQQPIDLGSQLGVAGTRLPEQDLTLGRGAPKGGGEEGADLPPALGRHWASPPSWPRSQARAARQSPSTVAAETSSASATSAMDSPAKNRRTTTRP